ncbi:MAG: Hpt domain-containing protein [Pseudomonadota bacterium]
MSHSTAHHGAAIDLPDLMDKIGDDSDLLQELLTAFVEDHQNDGQRLRAAIEQRNQSSGHMLAHSLKGLAGNLSAMRLFEVTREVDDLIQAGRWEVITPALDRFDAELARVLQFIEKQRGF